MNPVRIGRITFTNILPLYSFFDQQRMNIEFISQYPTELNQCMASGEIDVGPVSSFEYGKNQEKYVLLPDISVSSRGPVRSIFLFTKEKKLSDLNGVSIAVTNTSATSVALLQILLEKFEGIHAEYVSMEPDFNRMMNNYGACLLIGDEAIKAYWRSGGWSAYDLGEEWYNRTGLSMTFAVWAVRREIVRDRYEELSQIYDRFMESKKKGARFQQLIIDEAIGRLGGDSHFWATYYGGLCYHLTDEEMNGLQLFYDYACDLNLLSRKVNIDVLCFRDRVNKKN